MKYKFFSGFLFLILISCHQNYSEKAMVPKSDTVFVEKIVYLEKDLYPSPFTCGDYNSQTDMNICASQEYLYFDSIMVQKYNSLLTSLEPVEDTDEAQKKYLSDLRKKLILSQKKWDEYMLSNSAYVSREYEGGTIRSMKISLQKTSDTKARILALDYLMAEG